MGKVVVGQKLGDRKPVALRYFILAMNMVMVEEDFDEGENWLERFEVAEIKLGLVCTKGQKGPHDPTPNQDNWSLTRLKDDTMIYVVCDGHGPFGHIASFRVCQLVPYHIARCLTQESDPEKAVSEAFFHTQMELL